MHSEQGTIAGYYFFCLIVAQNILLTLKSVTFGIEETVRIILHETLSLNTEIVIIHE
jgi:hypothetical protein